MDGLKVGQIRRDPLDGEVVRVVSQLGEEWELVILKRASFSDNPVGMVYTWRETIALGAWKELDESYTVSEILKLYED